MKKPSRKMQAERIAEQKAVTDRLLVLAPLPGRRTPYPPTPQEHEQALALIKAATEDSGGRLEAVIAFLRKNYVQALRAAIAHIEDEVDPSGRPTLPMHTRDRCLEAIRREIRIRKAEMQGDEDPPGKTP